MFGRRQGTSVQMCVEETFGPPNALDTVHRTFSREGGSSSIPANYIIVHKKDYVKISSDLQLLCAEYFLSNQNFKKGWNGRERRKWTAAETNRRSSVWVLWRPPFNPSLCFYSMGHESRYSALFSAESPPTNFIMPTRYHFAIWTSRWSLFMNLFSNPSEREPLRALQDTKMPYRSLP